MTTFTNLCLSSLSSLDLPLKAHLAGCLSSRDSRTSRQDSTMANLKVLG